jgi:hypothetical protein
MMDVILQLRPVSIDRGMSSGQHFQRRRALVMRLRGENMSLSGSSPCAFRHSGIMLWGSDKSSAKGSGFVTIGDGLAALQPCARKVLSRTCLRSVPWDHVCVFCCVCSSAFVRLKSY